MSQYENNSINDARNVHLGNNIYTGASDKGCPPHILLGRSIYMSLILTCAYIEDPSLDDLLKELFVSDPKVDRERISRHNRRAEGTCKWLLETDEYQRWHSGESAQTFWLLGLPGSGKTVMSCFLVEKLEASAFVMSYFCDDKIEGRRTATDILRGILWQLFRHREDCENLFKLVKDDYKYKQGSLIKSLDDMWNMFIRILPELRDPVYLFLDALDECGKPSREDLLSLLEDFRPPSTFRMFITGRPELDIEESAGGGSLSLDRNPSHDLQAFIHARVKRLREKKSHFPGKFFEDLELKLLENADGTFLWVSLVLEDIGSARTTARARKKLESLPEGLTQAYRRLMANIEEEESEIAMLVLQWLVVSTKPMTVIEISTVLILEASPKWDSTTSPTTVDIDERKDGYKACGMLVNYNKDDDTISLLHQSLKEYLLKWHIDQKAIYLQSTKTLWSYLSFNDISSFAEKVELYTNRWPSPQVRFMMTQHGLLEYAVKELCWQITAERVPSIVDFIRKSDNLEALPLVRDIWLYFFSECGNAEGIEAVLDKGVCINVKLWRGTGRPSTALCVAAENQKEAAVALLLKRGADPNIKASDGITALHLAAMKGSASLVRLLLEWKADANARTAHEIYLFKDGGSTALHFATQSNNVAIISRLLEGETNLEVEDDLGRTPLVTALENRRPKGIISALLEAESDLEHGGVSRDLWSWRRRHSPSQRAMKRESVLFSAVRGEAHGIAQQIINKGINVNARDAFGLGAISFAVVKGDLEMVRLLLDNGADIEHGHPETESSLIHLALRAKAAHSFPYLDSTSQQATAERTAHQQTAAKMVSLLAKRGARLDTLGGCHDLETPNWRCPPLHAAVRYNNQEAVEALLDAKADVSMEDTLGMSALHHAASYGLTDLVMRLLEKGSGSGSDLERRDSHGWTPLHFAVYRLDPRTAKLLISRGADPNAVTSLGDTMIHLVHSQMRHPGSPKLAQKIKRLSEVMKMLLPPDSINARGRGGQTPLHIATSLLDTEVVRTIINLGGDGNIRDDEGHNTLHKLALQSGIFEKQFARDNILASSLLQSLLRSGAQIDARDDSSSRRTPLSCAIEKRGFAIINALLEHGADPKGMCSEATLATECWVEPANDLLILAAERGYSFIVAVLSVIKSHHRHEFTAEAKTQALSIAIRKANPKVMRTLLLIGAGVQKGGR